jgi:hypothetical protein
MRTNDAHEKRLVKESLIKSVEEFDKAAQHWGYESNEGDVQSSYDAKEKYLAAKANLTNLILNF